MAYEYDVLTIGLGPAGMAVSVMGSEMGLKVCAIEKSHIGGECMNVGCIPSKALLAAAETRHAMTGLSGFDIQQPGLPKVGNPFARVREHIQYINEKKTMGMFKKVDLILGEGAAEFVDAHTVQVGDRKVTARKIFVAVGTHPMVPPIPGLDQVDYLTNESMFSLDEVPESMVIIGGGAIGCEMAQAFSRLGCKCSIVQMDPYLVPPGEPSAGELLEEVFKKEGIEVYNSRHIEKVEKRGDEIAVITQEGEELLGKRLLVGAGRRIDLSSLKLDRAGVAVTKRGAIQVNKHLQTTQRHIYGVGDCNGHWLLSHAAMHQGMIALMNSMMPPFMRRDFRKYSVPWTVFTEPQVSHVGMREKDLKDKNIKYETITSRYQDYGAAIAEHRDDGYVKVYASKTGKIYGAGIVGYGSGEMINEWALAIQKKLRLADIMMLQHSFPTMGFLTKRVAETWMMNRMESTFLKRMCAWMFRRMP